MKYRILRRKSINNTIEYEKKEGSFYSFIILNEENKEKADAIIDRVFSIIQDIPVEEISMKDVEKEIYKAFKLPLNSKNKKLRKAENVRVRRILVRILIERGFGSSEIGRFLDFHHSTIINLASPVGLDQRMVIERDMSIARSSLAKAEKTLAK